MFFFIWFRTGSYMEITTALTFFFDTIFFIKMSTNPTFTMRTHIDLTTLLDITKTHSPPMIHDVNILN